MLYVTNISQNVILDKRRAFPSTIRSRTPTEAIKTWAFIEYSIRIAMPAKIITATAINTLMNLARMVMWIHKSRKTPDFNKQSVPNEM